MLRTAADRLSETTGAMFWVVELSAFAVVSASVGTIAGIAAFLAGIKNDRTVESRNGVASSVHTGALPANQVSVAKLHRTRPLRMSEASMIVLRSSRSARTPPYRPNSRKGAVSQIPANPTIAYDPVTF